MEEIRFRQAVIADLPAIIGLLADDELGRQREEIGPPPSPNYEKAFYAIEGDPNQLLVVAEQHGDVVGKPFAHLLDRDVFGHHFPAMSMVVVAGLVEDDAKVEIEATAHIG